MSCADFRQNWDNIDYRHIDHLTLRKVQAMELAKHVKIHTSQLLRNINSFSTTIMYVMC